MHPRRRSKPEGEDETITPAVGSEITYNGVPARPEDALRMLAANGLLDPKMVEETIRGREEAIRRKGVGDGG